MNNSAYKILFSMIFLSAIVMAIDEIENLVTQVDNLEDQINAYKNKIVHGVVFTEPEVDVLIDKIVQQARLNRKLKQLREGHDRLRALVHGNPNK